MPGCGALTAWRSVPSCDATAGCSHTPTTNDSAARRVRLSAPEWTPAAALGAFAVTHPHDRRYGPFGAVCERGLTRMRTASAGTGGANATAVMCAVCNSTLPLFYFLGSEGQGAFTAVSFLMIVQASVMALWLAWTRPKIAGPLQRQPLLVLLAPPAVIGRGGRWAPAAVLAVARCEYLVWWAAVAVLDASAVAVTAAMWPLFLVVWLAWVFGGGVAPRRLAAMLAVAAAGSACVGISREAAADALATSPLWSIAAGLALGAAGAALGAASVTATLLCGRRSAVLVADPRSEAWCAVYVLAVSLAVVAVPVGAVGLVLSRTLSWPDAGLSAVVGAAMAVSAITVRAANSRTRRVGVNMVLMCEVVLAQVWLKAAGASFGAVVPFVVGACLITAAAAAAQFSLTAAPPSERTAARAGPSKRH